MKPTTHASPETAQTIGYKARLLAIALGGGALLFAGCGPRDVTHDDTRQDGTRDTAAAPARPMTDNEPLTGQRAGDQQTGTWGQQQHADSPQRGLGEQQQYRSPGAEPAVGMPAAGVGLEQRIRTELMTAPDLNLQPQQLNQIQIRVEQNTVHLSGNVPSAEIRENIEDRVNNIDGVQNVRNDLRVSQ